ncbi:MAG: hypothetical protein QOD04_3674, partial [Pseudonocardiales bacterium]|nr:hypothetical protein [Pseudonocardiales bacterium]
GREGLLRRRRDLGLPAGGDDLVLVDDQGQPVPTRERAKTLRFAQAVRVSLEGNSAFCRGLLGTRYGDREGPR